MQDKTLNLLLGAVPPAPPERERMSAEQLAEIVAARDSSEPMGLGYIAGLAPDLLDALLAERAALVQMENERDEARVSVCVGLMDSAGYGTFAEAAASEGWDYLIQGEK